MSHFSTRTIGEMVAVGATDARSVRLWVRTHEAGPHGVELWNDSAQHHHTVALAPPINADGTTSFLYPDDIPGAVDLPPGVAFQARVRRGATILGTVSFETAPANAATVSPNVAIAFASCHQPFDDDGSLHMPSLATLESLDAALRERNVKRVLLMGDQMYADYPPKQSLFDDAYFATVAPPGRSSILECSRDEVRVLYQRRYHAFFSIEPFQQLLASYPCYPVPDDHEIRDNFGSAPEHATDAWLALRDGALDAFDDYQGQLTAPRGSPRRTSFDYALAYADIAIYGLDVRSQRRHDGTTLHVCTDEQFTELERFLAASTSQNVLMLVTSVPLAIYPSWVASWGTRLLGKDNDAADRWSHPDATESRRRLTAMLFEHQRQHPHQRVLLLGGDIHIGCGVKFVWRDPSVPPMYQLVSSSISNLTDVLSRNLARVAPHLDPQLKGGADDLWSHIELIEGATDANKNPYAGLNAGVVSLARLPDGGYDITFELLSHDADATPPRVRAVFSTKL